MSETPSRPPRGGIEDADYGPIYKKCKTVVDRLALLVGSYTSTTVEEQVVIALQEGVAGLADPLRREAAGIMLGLQTGPEQAGVKASHRLEAVTKLYREEKASRTNKQVIQRSELPAIREELADSLLDAEAMFMRARRSDSALRQQRRNEAHEHKTISWPQYGQMVTTLADRIRKAAQAETPLDTTIEDLSSWAIVATGRGGMPLATHLSHQLDIGMVGFASIWEYRSRSGEDRIVVDALYTPAQDIQGLPRKFIVVHDIVTGGTRIKRIIVELRNRYPQPIDVYQASLLRNIDGNKDHVSEASQKQKQEAGLGPKVFYTEATSPRTWYDFPWEASAHRR